LGQEEGRGKCGQFHLPPEVVVPLNELKKESEGKEKRGKEIAMWSYGPQFRRVMDYLPGVEEKIA